MEQEITSNSSYTSHGDSASSWYSLWKGREGAEAVKTTRKAFPEVLNYLVTLL